MEDFPSKFKCSTCDKAVLNRRVSHCLYCGATLPADFLFSTEKMARLDEEERHRERIRDSNRPTLPAEGSSVVGGIADGIETASDAAGLASDIIKGVGDLFD